MRPGGARPGTAWLDNVRQGSERTASNSPQFLREAMEVNSDLREYQRRAVTDTLAALTENHAVLLVSPTGSGKSRMGASILKARAGERSLWVAHRIELLRQARAELIDAGVPESDVGILSGVDRINPNAPIMVCSLQMVQRLPPEWKPGIIVFDEAHRTAAKTYQEIREAHKDARLLGLTATPVRLDGKPLGDTYSELIVAAQPRELEDAGWIAAPMVYGIGRKDLRRLTDHVKRRDPTAFKKTTVLAGNVVSEWKRLAEGRTTIVFAGRKDQAINLTSRFSQHGIAAAYIGSMTSADHRQEILDKLASGKLTVAVNVDITTEGFDCPRVKCVVVATQTSSLTRWIQWCGRSSRVHENVQPIIIDHGGNIWRHGMPNADREWALHRGQQTQHHPIPEASLCEKCSLVLRAGERRCPFCDAPTVIVGPQPVARVVEAETRLTRILDTASPEERARAEKAIEALAVKRGLGEGWKNTARGSL